MYETVLHLNETDSFDTNAFFVTLHGTHFFQEEKQDQNVQGKSSTQNNGSEKNKEKLIELVCGFVFPGTHIVLVETLFRQNFYSSRLNEEISAGVCQLKEPISVSC